MWSTSAGGHLMKVVNLTGFTVFGFLKQNVAVFYNADIDNVLTQHI
jgi:hypothetical protein